MHVRSRRGGCLELLRQVKPSQVLNLEESEENEKGMGVASATLQRLMGLNCTSEEEKNKNGRRKKAQPPN